jgi:hypothetical protein
MKLWSVEAAPYNIARGEAKTAAKADCAHFGWTVSNIAMNLDTVQTGYDLAVFDTLIL